MMNSVSAQIQRAISDAISNQVLPQIQNALKAGSEHVTQKGWNVPAGRPEYIAEDCRNEKKTEAIQEVSLVVTVFKTNSRTKLTTARVAFNILKGCL